MMESSATGHSGVSCLASFGSRDQLLCDLADAVDPGAPPRVLAIFGLAGFHAVVASLGRPDGQKLLATLAERFVGEAGAAGRRYWPREDEFALLFDCPPEPLQPVLAATADALRERRGHVQVAAGVGTVRLPAEATDAIAALRLADDRLAGALPSREPRSQRRHLRPVPDLAGGEAPEPSEASGAVRRWHAEQLLGLARTLTELADAARIVEGGGGLSGQPREPTRIPLLAREIALQLTALRTLGGPEMPEAEGIAAEAGRRPGSIGARVPVALDEIGAALSRT